MISKEHPKKVKIHITTYTKPTNKRGTEMSKPGTIYVCRNDHNSRFICSICLNTNARQEESKKFECDRRKSRSCPICQGTSDMNANNSYEIVSEHNKCENEVNDSRTKNVQTSRTNVDQGLNLLNEVLTVFQSKKEPGKDRHSKAILLKDACVSAEFAINKPKLSVSKVFQLSIEEGGIQESGKFSVVNSCQPKVRSQYSIDLIKHKSSSIPQMKMEELKNSFKEKTKTNKDAIEEVNRMFATVKRDDSFDNINRPMIRNGPRVLPVVKTFCKQSRRQSDEDITDQSKPGCKCCQTNYYMSSGDSLAKPERCEKNVYMQCCHKNNNRDVQTEVLICERCRKPGYAYD